VKSTILVVVVFYPARGMIHTEQSTVSAYTT
jgi:hypothetical protein